VLFPVRNGADHIQEAIDSVSRQSFREFEVVVVDDGSTDGTPEILREWAETDGRVRLFSQNPKGVAAALERARREARGRYLARMDADDIALPGRLEAQLALMESDRSLVACGCQIEYFPEDHVRDGARRYQNWINGLVTPDEIERDLFVECPLPHPTFFLRARQVESVGGYRDRGWPEDYDLVFRLWLAGGRFAKVTEPLLRWRESRDRLSRTHPAYFPEAFRRCKIHYLKATLLRHQNEVVVWGAGPTGKMFARSLQSKGIGVRSFVDLDPRKIGKSIHGALVVAPEQIQRYRGTVCLAAVGQRGARTEIRQALRQAGWREMTEFVAVA
jgi:glycosyltransferase involved in cell wall biosynthesis